MTREPVVASLSAVRRLALVKQHLGPGPRSRATPEAVLRLVRDLGYVQWDPVAIVAPSHLLSFWARLEGFRPSTLESLLWKRKQLFEHWTPMASLVLTSDYPLFYSLMRRYPTSLSHSWGSQRSHARRFLATHQELRRRVLRTLRGGPRTAGDFADHERTRRNDGDWGSGSDLAEMLWHLLMQGEVMVVGHDGSQNLWGLTEQFLPPSVERQLLPEDEVARIAAERSLRALGTGAAREVSFYFVRGRYHDLPTTLRALEAAGTIRRVAVPELGPRDVRYVHADDLETLRSLEEQEWVPRMSLVPPFDNLVCSTQRTDRLFGFHYIREQFFPKEKRRFGTYVLPIVWGDRLIGRLDPALDRSTQTLRVHSIHAEPGAPEGREVGAALDASIRSLAQFVGAREVAYPARAPAGWKAALR